MMKISIIVPIYNVEEYLEECLQSVADQTLVEGLECILVDDCGQDNSMEVVHRFVDAYRGAVSFHIRKHDKNRGLSAARNTGIKAATGEYIYLLDSDDYLVPECIETLYSIAKENNADVVQGAYITDSQHLNYAISKTHPTFTDDRRYIKRTLLNYDRNPVMAQNRLVRRQFIIDNALWFKEGIIHEDNYWTFFLAKHVRRMAFCPEKLYFYRETPGSITKSKNIEKEIKAFTTMIRDFTENIDSFECGAQKRYIFLHLLLLSQYRKDIDCGIWKKLLRSFLHTCTFVEKIVFAVAMTSKGVIKQKSINLLQRLFLLQFKRSIGLITSLKGQEYSPFTSDNSKTDNEHYKQN
ncbi:MAG: glycosyltransferase family 2 protein [Alloprevotella sp.]